LNILSLENIHFNYLSGQEKSVFSDMALSVKKGEILTLLGPSGCGKSTLLKLAAGFILPQKGGVFYRDNPVHKPYLKGQMIFQDPHQLLPWLTVEENICFPEKAKKVEKDKINQLLKMVGLEKYSAFFPGELSGGMKQRCALGRALYVNPEILFMDEPFVSLDAPSRHSLQELVLELWKEWGITIVFVTHDIGEALFLSDRMALLDGKGKNPPIRKNPLSHPRDRWSEPFLKELIVIHSLVESSLGI
jgi:NitT/TauT family transport system ATP-binding protein